MRGGRNMKRQRGKNLQIALLTLVFFGTFLFTLQKEVEALSIESITEITDPASGINYGGAKFSPDGTKIAAVSDRGLEVMDLDGSNKKVIVKDKYVFSYSWSPDGRKIAFNTVSGEKGEIINIWVVNVDGTGLKQLTFGGNDNDPAWSSDGSKMAFRRGEGFNWFQRKHRRSIWIVNIDGTNLNRITPYGDDFSQPAFSPDGTKIACTRRPEYSVWVVNIDGSNLKKVVEKASSPKWSLDGNKLWCRTKIVDADGTNPISLIFEGGFPILSPDWNWVCYAVSKMGEGAEDSICIDSQLYIINQDGTEKIRVTDEYGMIYIPSDWSLDGNFILANKARGPLMEEELPSSVIIIKLKK